MRAQVDWNIFDTVASHAWPVHRPVAKVAHNTGFAVRCTKENKPLENTLTFLSDLLLIIFLLNLNNIS